MCVFLFAINVYETYFFKISVMEEYNCFFVYTTYLLLLTYFMHTGFESDRIYYRKKKVLFDI